MARASPCASSTTCSATPARPQPVSGVRHEPRRWRSTGFHTTVISSPHRRAILAAMKTLRTVSLACAVFVSGGGSQQLPRAIECGYDLPNGWRLTPLGRAIQTEDMVLNVSVAPDRKSVVALHSGFNPH